MTNIFRLTVIILLNTMPQVISLRQGRRIHASVVIMIKATNREAVNTIISQDPFNINGIADYQIVEFTPTMFCDESLQSFL